MSPTKKKWDIKDIQEWPPEKHEVGAVIPVAGNAIQYETGGWRSERPVHDAEKCTHCLNCYFYCPDTAVVVKGRTVLGIDLRHCKGCGICAAECRVHAIDMCAESEFEDNGGDKR